MKVLHAGTSGFRGVVNTEITPEHALRIGKIYTSIVAEGISCPPRMAIGHDNRAGAQMLAQAASAGALSMGAQVLVVGNITTGFFSHILTLQKCDGAIFITGSHMPANRIGIIPLNADGTYCTPEVTDLITTSFARKIAPEGVQFLNLQTASQITVRDLTNPYLSFLFEALPTRLAQIQKNLEQLTEGVNLKVLVDCVNGPASLVAKEALEIMGCKVTLLHREMKPVPDRPSQCTAENCTKASQIVREQGFALGVCFDTDADRSLFIDENGNVLDDDVVGAIFAKATLQAGDACVTPVNAGPLITEICESLGASVHHCRIGQPSTGKAIKEVDAVFAYEAAAGKFCWPRQMMWYDGVYAAMRMVEIMATRQMKLSELVAEFPKFYRDDLKVELPEDIDREALAVKTFGFARERYADNITAEFTMDGLRLNLTDGAVLIMRLSGTEPLARVSGISKDEGRAFKVATVGQSIWQRAATEI
ncbi:MAG: hypothetical protein ABIH21_05145 [Patescibacteria group bacterium]